jgi:hypothetical protein
MSANGPHRISVLNKSDRDERKVCELENPAADGKVKRNFFPASDPTQHGCNVEWTISPCVITVKNSNGVNTMDLARILGK